MQRNNSSSPAGHTRNYNRIQHAAQQGQGLVEYALLLVLVAVAAIGTMSVLGAGISNGMSEVNSAISVSVADLGDWDGSIKIGDPSQPTSVSPTTQSPVIPTEQNAGDPVPTQDGQPSNPSLVPPTAVTPLAMATNTLVPPANTNTPVPPVATNTSVSIVKTNTPVPPAATNTNVPPVNNSTPVVPAATNTLVPPVNTNQPAPTAASTLALPTAVNTPVPVVQSCTAAVPAGDVVALKNAINAANTTSATHDTICLSNSTYSFTTASSGIALPVITTRITIVGNGAVLERGSNAPTMRFLSITSSGALTLTELSLRNGSSDDKGGAILNAGAVTLDKVSFTANKARYGGALHSSGHLTITGSTFVSNTANEEAGAIYANSGMVTITDTTFEANSARYGSGLYTNATAQLTNITMRGNTANEYGAGIYQKSGSLTLSGGLFETNTARAGNGLYVSAGTSTLTGVVMRNNVATEQGAGVYVETGTLSIANSAFRSNRARYGAAIYNHGSMTVADTSFSDNAAQEEGGAVYNTSNGNEVQDSCFTGNTARSGSAIYNTSNGNLQARRNWWGSPTGPTAAMVTNDKVKTDQFLTTGCPL